jgi:CheY-like chemotaxis protein
VSSGRKRILLVEDDVGVREGISDCLVLEGYEVDTAANGAEALARLRAGTRPGLILLDLVMPVMNGAQLLARLRHEPGLADIPVVLMTAAMPPGARLPPASGYLSKPFDLSELLGLAERHCAAPPGLATAGI